MFVNFFQLHNRLNLGFCGRFTPAEAMSLVCSAALVMVWIVTGHWVLMDGMFTQYSYLTKTTMQIVLLTTAPLPSPKKNYIQFGQWLGFFFMINFKRTVIKDLKSHHAQPFCMILSLCLPYSPPSSQGLRINLLQ